MKRKLIKLIDVKSIVTLTLTIIFSIMTLLNRISSNDFMSIFTIIIGFYFGTQYEKHKGGDSDE